MWGGDRLPFRVEFFHLGYLYQEPVHVNEFTPTHVQPVRFVPDFFDYRTLRLPGEIPANTGYAGFRVLNTPGKWDELGAFQGASYFRLLGQGQVYGMSARGLALDCGEDGRAEEFPIFTDWWLGKPQHDDDVLLLYALLDSVSCTGRVRVFHQARGDDAGGSGGGGVFPGAGEHRGGGRAEEAAGDAGVCAADEHVLVWERVGAEV